MCLSYSIQNQSLCLSYSIQNQSLCLSYSIHSLSSGTPKHRSSSADKTHSTCTCTFTPKRCFHSNWLSSGFHSCLVPSVDMTPWRRQGMARGGRVVMATSGGSWYSCCIVTLWVLPVSIHTTVACMKGRDMNPGEIMYLLGHFGL